MQANMSNSIPKRSQGIPPWVHVLRLLYFRLGWTRGMGKLVMRLAQSTQSLQLLPLRTSDGRVLHLDLRETACMPYLLHGAIANEVGETMFIRSVVRSGEVAIDVGASVGWYSTLLAGIVGAKGQV